FGKSNIEFQDLINFGALSGQMANFLILAARVRLNIIISGGTGSGKTTLLNALSKYIDPTERILTMEDAAELRLMQPH
ncbi:ATPase, T2SS/T4P/T4SS family, partial [Escherichia coli]